MSLPTYKTESDQHGNWKPLEIVPVMDNNNKDIDDDGVPPRPFFAVTPVRRYNDNHHHYNKNHHQRHHHRNNNSSSSFSEKEELVDFHLMRITITIYGLSGLLCRTDETTYQSSTSISRGKKRRQQQQHDPRSKNEQGSTISKPPRKRSESSSLDDDTSHCPIAVYPPLTAVVSTRRNVLSSSTTIETFLPSLRLKTPTAIPGSIFRHNASWPGDKGAALLNTSKADYSTFEIIRVMQREAYTRDVTISQVSNYVHETVDINVSIARGQELIRLGVASLVVTGDEEGEIIVNVPVKPLETKKLKRRSWPSKKSQPKNCSFSANPKQIFSLDDNSTLQAGVRVVPEPMAGVDRWADYDFPRRQDAFEEFPDTRCNDETSIIELSGEDTIIERIMAGRDDANGYFHTIRTRDVKSKEPQPTPSEPATTFFCGALQMFNSGGFLIQGDTMETERTKPRTAQRKEKAIVMPLSLLSSVSVSTDADLVEGQSYIFEKQRTVL